MHTMSEFVDREREAAKEFEEAKKLLEEGKIEDLKRKLKELIDRDPYFLEPYIFLNEIYEMEGKLREAEEILGEG